MIPGFRSGQGETPGDLRSRAVPDETPFPDKSRVLAVRRGPRLRQMMQALLFVT